MSRKVPRLKVVLLGKEGAGKSSLALRFAMDRFHENEETTAGAAFLQKEADIDGSKLIYEIWDTAGQERFKSFAPMYYRGAGAGIVVYDVTVKESFDRAKEWVKELERMNGQSIVILLAGNKIDQESLRKVSLEEGAGYAADHNLLFMETSAKANINTSEIFLAVGRKHKEDAHQWAATAGESSTVSFAPDLDRSPASKKCKC